MPLPRIAHWPATARLATGCFAGLMLLFLGLAQANLWFHVGHGGFPGPDHVLFKYHGRPDGSKLHHVLDAALSKDDPKSMWNYLGFTPEEVSQRRREILAWVEAGAPREGWDAVAPVFTGAETCGQCHVPNPGAPKADLPFDSYDHVKPVTEPDRGIPWGPLFVTAHNHFFTFSVAALLLTLLLSCTPLKGLFKTALVLGAFGGPVLDVGSWFLTKLHGAPWHFGVMLGGGIFGGCIGTMALLVLWEAWFARPPKSVR